MLKLLLAGILLLGVSNGLLTNVYIATRIKGIHGAEQAKEKGQGILGQLYRAQKLQTGWDRIEMIWKSRWSIKSQQ